MDPLLKLLRDRGRESTADLARMLDCPEADVIERIRDFEQRGIIRGYQAVIDEERVAPDQVVAIIEVKLTPEREGGFDYLARRISRFPEVVASFLVSGQADLMLFVEGTNLREVAMFVSEKLSTIQGVTATATAFRLKTYKNHGVLMDGQDEYERLKISP